MKYLLPFLLLCSCVLPSGCVKNPECPAVLPWNHHLATSEMQAAVDPDLRRMLSGNRAFGLAPTGFRWSDDSRRFAYLRSPENRTDTPGRRLWLFDMDSLRERPALPDPQPAVIDYGWVDNAHLLVLSRDQFYAADLDGGFVRVGPELTDPGDDDDRMQISADGSQVAFVRGCALWRMQLSDLHLERVSRGAEPGCPGRVPAALKDGFDTGAGFGWSPDGTALWFYESGAEGRMQVSVYQPTRAATATVLSAAPGEYLPWVAFHPDGARLCALWTDQLQTRQTVVFCPLDGGACQKVIEETDPRWLVESGPLFFFGDAHDFIRISTGPGQGVIRHHAPDGTPRGALTGTGLSVKQIHRVSRTGDEIYFTAFAEGDFSGQVYRMTRSNGQLAELTAGGAHTTSISPDGLHWLDTVSTLSTPAKTDLKDAGGALLSPVDAAMRRVYATPGIENRIERLVAPGRGDVESTYAVHWTRPEGMDQRKKYPLIIVVESNVLTDRPRDIDTFGGGFSAFRNHMARMGFVLATVHLDAGRLPDADRSTRIHRNPVDVLTNEFFAAVSSVASLPTVDETRIGLIGIGAGATVAARLLAHSSGEDVRFRAAALLDAEASFEDVLSANIERIMQRPSDNPDGYAATRLIPLAQDIEIPLLIGCGETDDDRTVPSTERLMRGFLEAGRLIEMECGPAPGNSLDREALRIHRYSRMVRFFARTIP